MKNKLVNSISFISFNSFSILILLLLFIIFNNNCFAFNNFSSIHNNSFAFISIHENFSSENEESFSNYFFLFGIALVFLFLLSSFSFYLIFRLFKKFDALNYQFNKLNNLLNSSYNYFENNPNSSPHKVEKTNDIDSYFVSDSQNLDTPKINVVDDKSKFNPSSSNAPNQEPIIKYIELPEKDGFFLNKHLTDNEGRRSLYKIIFYPNDKIEFDILVNKTDIHRNVMDNHAAVLKPACDYIINPDPDDSKIIKTDSNLGTLKQINDKLKIVNKLKISFE